MIEDLKINRLEFLHVCRSLESAMKNPAGTHWVTLQFSPGELSMTSSWGAGLVPTSGRESAKGRIAYNYIKRLIRAQGLQKLKTDTISCILAPNLGKLVIENAALKMAFD